MTKKSPEVEQGREHLDYLMSGKDAFRSIRWARNLPVMRTAKGHVDDKLHTMAFVMASYADGSTGTKIFPSLKTLARAVHVADEDAAKEILERGEALGLWSTEEMSVRGTHTWTLNFSEELTDRLEAMEAERISRKKATRAGRNARHYDKVKKTTPGAVDEVPGTPSHCDASSLRLKTPLSPSEDALDPVLRHPPVRLKTHSTPSSDALSTPPTIPITRPLDLPLGPSLGDLPLRTTPALSRGAGSDDQEPTEKDQALILRPQFRRGGATALAMTYFDTDDD